MAYDRCQSCEGSPACSRSQRWEPRHGAHKRGVNSKIHLAVDAHGMPVRTIVTSGTTADCTQAIELMDGIAAECLLADKAYDTDVIVDYAVKSGMQVVIPPSASLQVI